MDEQQKQRAIAIIAKIQGALDQGVAHFNKEGNRLTTVAAVVDAWAQGGLTIKEPGKEETIQEWRRAS
jgi:hypothetical protein